MPTVGLLIACDIVRGSEQRLSSEHNQQHTNTALLLLVLSNGTAARLQSQLDAVTTQQLPLNVSGQAVAYDKGTSSHPHNKQRMP
jgi:hypothetical protein